MKHPKLNHFVTSYQAVEEGQHLLQILLAAGNKQDKKIWSVKYIYNWSDIAGGFFVWYNEHWAVD